MGFLDKLSQPLRKQLDQELAQLAEVERSGGQKKSRSAKTSSPKSQKQSILIRKQAQKEAAEIRKQAEEIRHRAVAAEVAVERQLSQLAEERKTLAFKKEEWSRKLAEVKKKRQEETARLEKIAKLTKKEAEERLLALTERRLSSTVAQKIREAKEEIKNRADEQAKEILLEVMRHGVTDYVAEYTVSTVHLPDENMKGRIIGREGRNIRAFEKATGVEIELDESNDIVLSSFDSVRREIARRSLLILVRDRRIQPSRIEEVVQKTKKEVEKIMFEEGEKLAHVVGVYRLHPDLIRLLGRFKFRFSYGQNMIAHTLEETKIGLALAHELGADVNVVRLGCLLHDLGKVVTDEEGTHVQLGVNLAKKYRLPEEVINCIAEHHEDKPFSSAESRIVWIADAISGSRPGARYEPHEEYLKRLTEIEKIAGEFAGVKEAFAYQAGRDVRVMVKPEEISDDQLTILADKIARLLEEKASYAGQVKVTCIRETRAAETTKAK